LPWDFSTRDLKAQCRTNQLTDLILCNCSSSCIFFPRTYDTFIVSHRHKEYAVPGEVPQKSREETGKRLGLSN